MDDNKKIRIISLVRPSIHKNIKIRSDIALPDSPMIWLEVRLDIKSILLAGVYRERRNSEGQGDLASQKERFSVILKQIESASCLGRPVVIAGDWNLDHNKFDDEVYRLRCLVQDLTLIKKSCRLEPYVTYSQPYGIWTDLIWSIPRICHKCPYGDRQAEVEVWLGPWNAHMTVW